MRQHIQNAKMQPLRPNGAAANGAMWILAVVTSKCCQSRLLQVPNTRELQRIGHMPLAVPLTSSARKLKELVSIRRRKVIVHSRAHALGTVSSVQARRLCKTAKITLRLTSLFTARRIADASVLRARMP